MLAQLTSTNPRLQVLHKVAETPLVCHAVDMALGRGWSPLVVVVNPQNAAPVKEVSHPGCRCICHGKP